MNDELDIYEAPVPVAPANLFGASNPREVVARSSEAAEALVEVIERKKLYATIQGKSHVLVDGWTLLGSMMGVFPVVVWTRKMDEPEGWEARVEARTLAGNVVGAAEAECLRAEKRWKEADDYAVRSMAQTRATSKALRGPLGFIVHLAGFSATPAEEMPSDDRKVSEPGASVPMVTQDQHAMIGVMVKKIAEASNQTTDKVAADSRAWCKDNFGVSSRADLTSAQASELITYLKGILELAEAPIG